MLTDKTQRVIKIFSKMKFLTQEDQDKHKFIQIWLKMTIDHKKNYPLAQSIPSNQFLTDRILEKILSKKWSKKIKMYNM